MQILTCLVPVLGGVWMLLGEQGKGQHSTLRSHTKGRAGQWSLPEVLAAPARCSWMRNPMSYDPWDGAAWVLITISELILRLRIIT